MHSMRVIMGSDRKKEDNMTTVIEWTNGEDNTQASFECDLLTAINYAYHLRSVGDTEAMITTPEPYNLCGRCTLTIKF